MPMRVGEMMVVVRAQDFASRTLRRVSGELDGMSRQQRIMAMGQAVQFQKMTALNRLAMAQSDARRLNYVRNGVLMRRELGEFTAALEAQAAAEKRLQKASMVRTRGPRGGLSRTMVPIRAERGRFRKGVSQADMREWQNATVALKDSTTALQRWGATAAEQQTRFQRLDKAVARFDQRLRQLPTWLQRTAYSQTAYGNALHRSNQRLREAYEGLDRAQKAELAFNNALRQLPAQRMADFGHAVSGIGRTMQLFGAITTASLAAASNSFANFNKEVMLAATQTVRAEAGPEAVVARSTQLQKQIMMQMARFPATAAEMAKASYDIYSSMEVSFGGGIRLLEQFNKLAVATGTDLETATSAGITVLNNFGGTSEDVASTLNLMVSTVRYGRMRLADFNTMLNKVAPAAANAGMSLRDVAGAMALITTRQPSQRQGATGIQRLLQIFQDPEFQEGVRKASNGVVELTKAGGGLKPLNTIVNELSAAFHELATEKGAATFFKRMTAIGRGRGIGRQQTIEAQKAWTFLSKNLDAYNRLQEKTTTNTKEFARAYKAMSESPGVRWDVMLNQLRVLALVIGEEAIPVFLQLGDYIAQAVHWFQNLDPHWKNLIIRTTAFVGVATALGGVLLGILGPIIILAAQFQKWRLAAAGAEARVLTLGAAMRALPLVAIALIVKQFVGWERMLKIMILGWVAWKIAAVTAATVAAAAHQAAATTFALAWRRALASTGIGLLVIAFGLAAEYVITHWEKVQKWFEDFWDNLRIGAMRAALDIIEPFTHIPGFLGSDFRAAKDAMLSEIGDIQIASHMKEEAAATAKAWDNLIKLSPKKARQLRKQLQNQFSGDAPLLAGQTMSDVKEQLDFANAAFVRFRKNREKDGKTLSEKYWSVGLKKAIEDINDASKNAEKLWNTQSEGADRAKRELKEYNQQLQNTIRQSTQSTIDSLRNMYMQLEDANRSAMGALFQGPWLSSQTFDLAKEWGILPRIDDMIRDLQERNKRFRTWRDDLAKVAKLGLPGQLIEEIKNMGPEEGQNFLTQIIKADPKKRAKLIAEWKNSERLIKQNTVVDFKDEIQKFKDAGVKMGDAIVNGFKSAEVGLWFDNWVKVTFPAVIDAAVSQAVSEWQASNPPPEGAPGTAPTSAPRIAFTGFRNEADYRAGFDRIGARMGNPGVWGDTYNINVTPPAGGPPPERDAQQQARTTAWTVANTLRNHRPVAKR